MSTTRRLGRGFAEIVGTTESAQSAQTLLVNQIQPGRYQPRQQIDSIALDELKASIKECGVIQPIVVRPLAHGAYEIVAGERRWRAAQALGLADIPVVIKTLTDQEALEFSLIENLQRDDLNPIEEAMGYARLVSEFNYSQLQLSQRIGKDAATVGNVIRLLKLPPVIQDAIKTGQLSQGHGKTLLGVESPEKQLQLFEKVLAEGLSVRHLEKLAMRWQPRSRKRREKHEPLPEIRTIEEGLRTRLGTKVSLSTRAKGGKIVIEYFSNEDLGRLLELFGVRLSVA